MQLSILFDNFTRMIFSHNVPSFYVLIGLCSSRHYGTKYVLVGVLVLPFFPAILEVAGDTYIWVDACMDGWMDTEIFSLPYNSGIHTLLISATEKHGEVCRMSHYDGHI